MSTEIIKNWIDDNSDHQVDEKEFDDMILELEINGKNTIKSFEIELDKDLMKSLNSIYQKKLESLISEESFDEKDKGVGKSTCGAILADLLDLTFIDLDEEFCKRVENVGSYIKSFGYEKYCLENSKVFYDILSQPLENFVFALSSGFLVHENHEELTKKHKKTIKELGISLLLLPSESIQEATEIVVKRQLSRGLGLQEDKEKTKFMQRFPIYKELGDIKIFSHTKPEIIAEQMKKEIVQYCV